MEQRFWPETNGNFDVKKREDEKEKEVRIRALRGKNESAGQKAANDFQNATDH